MATKDEIIRWEEFNNRYYELLLSGAEKGLVLPYTDDFFDKIRNYYYGGLSIPVLLLHKNMVNGYCYDRAPLVTLGFKDNNYNVLYGDIDSIRLNPNYIGSDDDYADHCIVEVEDDGIKWIIDTSIGLIFEKELYKKLENPRIRLIRNKEETKKFVDSQVSTTLEDDAFYASISLDCLKENLIPIQDMYMDDLKREVLFLQKKIDSVKIKMK